MIRNDLGECETPSCVCPEVPCESGGIHFEGLIWKTILCHTAHLVAHQLPE